MKDIAEWLASLGLSEHLPRFVENAVDLSIVSELTEQDLKDMGLPLGHRRIVLRAIAEMRGRRPARGQDFERGPRGDAERRQLTILFADMVGSTALSAQLDPEDMRAVIRAFHTCIADVVADHVGMVARYMGDGVLAYFGYPQAHEDDAEQAVRAGLVMIDAVAALRTPIAGVSAKGPDRHRHRHGGGRRSSGRRRVTRRSRL